MSWYPKNYTYLRKLLFFGESQGGICSFFAKRSPRRRCSPIAVDVRDDAITVVQLAEKGKRVTLVAGGNENRPVSAEPGSNGWQEWAVETIRKMTANNRFRGRDVIAAIPPSQVFIDHIKPAAKVCAKLQHQNDDKLQDLVLSKIKRKFPVEAGEAVIKCIPTEEDYVLVMATQRGTIDRYLAVYEKAGLRIKSIGAWPVALVNTYAKFFGRRKSDIEAVVMIVSIDPNCVNVVICRGRKLLFARSILMGEKQFDSEEITARLVLELSACRRQFSTMHHNPRIERLVFLSGRAEDTDLCKEIAKQLQMPAQMGDCLAAVEIANPSESGIDRRDCKVNLATAFGLGLGCET